MSHYLIELAIWTLIAYFLGCLAGWFIKNLGRGPAMVTAMAAPAVVAVVPKVMPAHVPHTPAPAAPAPMAKMERPRGISAARGGKPDDLQRISGIGPKNESILHTLGFFHFDQIAAWTAQEVAWVDDHLRFNGRIQREEWIKQAGLLASGKEQQFATEFGTGGLKGKDGQTHSGSQTRKR